MGYLYRLSTLVLRTLSLAVYLPRLLTRGTRPAWTGPNTWEEASAQFLRHMVAVRTEEIPALLQAFCAFLLLLASYFICQPLRDEAAMSLGTGALPLLFFASLISTVAAAPFSTRLLARTDISKGQALLLLYRTFSVCLIVFFVLYVLTPPPAKPPAPAPSSSSPATATATASLSYIASVSLPFMVVRASLFVFVALLNLFTIAAMWARLSDVMTSEAAARLFGFVGAGATLGQLLGSLLASLLAPMGPGLLLLSALLMESAARCALHIHAPVSLPHLYSSPSSTLSSPRSPASPSTSPPPSSTCQPDGPLHALASSPSIKHTGEEATPLIGHPTAPLLSASSSSRLLAHGHTTALLPSSSSTVQLASSSSSANPGCTGPVPSSASAAMSLTGCRRDAGGAVAGEQSVAQALIAGAAAGSGGGVFAGGGRGDGGSALGGEHGDKATGRAVTGDPRERKCDSTAGILALPMSSPSPTPSPSPSPLSADAERGACQWAVKLPGDGKGGATSTGSSSSSSKCQGGISVMGSGASAHSVHSNGASTGAQVLLRRMSSSAVNTLGEGERGRGERGHTPRQREGDRGGNNRWGELAHVHGDSRSQNSSFNGREVDGEGTDQAQSPSKTKKPSQRRAVSAAWSRVAHWLPANVAAYLPVGPASPSYPDSYPVALSLPAGVHSAAGNTDGVGSARGGIDTSRMHSGSSSECDDPSGLTASVRRSYSGAARERVGWSEKGREDMEDGAEGERGEGDGRSEAFALLHALSAGGVRGGVSVSASGESSNSGMKPVVEAGSAMPFAFHSVGSLTHLHSDAPASTLTPQHAAAAAAAVGLNGAAHVPPASAPPAILGGLYRAVTCPYLRHVCAFMLLTAFTSSSFYFQRAAVVATSVMDPVGRRRALANINSLSAAATAVFQLTLTGRLITTIGVPAALSSAPLAALVGMAAIAVHPSPAVVAASEAGRKIVNYVATRPGREVLFTVVSRKDKYEAKVTIDTVVQRVGDAIAAAAFRFLSLRSTVVLGPSGLAVCMLPVCLLWVFTAFTLGRQQQHMARLQRLQQQLSRHAAWQQTQAHRGAPHQRHSHTHTHARDCDCTQPHMQTQTPPSART